MNLIIVRRMALGVSTDLTLIKQRKQRGGNCRECVHPEFRSKLQPLIIRVKIIRVRSPVNQMCSPYLTSCATRIENFFVRKSQYFLSFKYKFK